MAAIRRADASGGISAKPGSAAVISLTSSMTAAMEVLKCQRPAKSWVILLMVWCSLRSSACASGEVGRGRGLTSLAAHGFAVTHAQAVDPAQEAADPGDSVLLPVQVAVGRRGKERVHAGGVGAIAGDHVVGRDHVALGLGHLGAIADDHALGEEACRPARHCRPVRDPASPGSRSGSRSGAGWRAPPRRCIDRWETSSRSSPG